MLTFVVIPPVFQAIDNEITGLERYAKDDGEQSGHHVQNTERSQLVFESHVMIICFYGFPADVPPRDESHKSTLALVSTDMRNESSRKSEALLIALRLSKIASVSETFLSGLAFCTRRRRKPKRFRILLMDFSQGSSSCFQPFWVIKASRMVLAVIRVYLNSV